MIALTAFSSTNLEPFAPMGIAGIGAAASSIFFSFIGLDAVSTAGEEVKNPQRTLPLAIILGPVIVTGALRAGRAGRGRRRSPGRASRARKPALPPSCANITGANWPALVLAAGAVISIFSVTLVVIYGQTRILFAMARDGMLPDCSTASIPRTMTPVQNTIIVGDLHRR